MLTASVLEKLVLKLAVVLIVSFFITTLYRVFFSRFSAAAVSKIYDETTLRVSRFPLSFFDTQPVGKITARFSSDYGNIFRLFGGPLAEFFSIVFDILSIIFISVLIHPLFLTPIIISILLFYLILKYNQNQLRHTKSDVAILRSPSVSHFSETVQGAVNIKLFNSVKNFSDRFNEVDSIFLNAKKAVFKCVFTFSTQLNIMSFLLFISNGLLSIYLVEKHIIGIGQVSVVLGYTVLATQSLQMFFEWFSQFDEALIGVQRLDDYLRAPLEENAKLPFYSEFRTDHKKNTTLISENQSLNNKSNNLIIKNLTLQYIDQKQPTLKNISLTITNGQKVGIIGKTGSGKSSLISAIMKLYPYSSGSITINENTKMSLEHYREHFSVVSQDTFFIQGSLKKNIDVFNFYSENKILQVLQQVRIQLPLHYEIEEKGANLSFGEKQLISLARCLLKNTDFIILDEATANIDPESEFILTQSLDTVLKNKTQIIIAHRLITIEKCDILVWIDSGEIKKIGSAKEVLEAFKASG